MKVVVILASVIFTSLLGFAQEKPSCQAYFQVVQEDPRIAGGFAAGMNEPQKTWWDKKGQKKYPGLCWNGSVLSGDKPRFLLVS